MPTTVTRDPAAFHRNTAMTAARLKAQMDQIVRATCEGMAEQAIKRTPVLTGRARGSWKPSLGTARTDYDPNYVDPTCEKQIAEVRTVTAGMRAGQRFYLSSHCPYIGALNDGHSRQAPAGFVQATVSEAATVGRAALRATVTSASSAGLSVSLVLP